ncbi:MAG: hypothetical protein LBB59_02150 [Campylobacteraceae bacterium]|nr:hypothetical protein [Campylobacteraceae bacterium]
MGTDNLSQTEQLQKEIKELLKQMGMSQAEFIRSCSDLSEEEINPEIENFKKQLQRKTTKTDTLKKYLKIIYESDEYEKLNRIKLRPKLKNDNFSQDFEKEMKKISEYIDEKIKENEELE